MINGFEDITYDFTPFEREVIIPLVVNGLRTKVGEHNAITNNAMCDKLYKFQQLKYKDRTGNTPPKRTVKKIHPARMRLIIRYIRVNKLISRLVSSSKGYWIERNDMKYKARIDSIYHRASANFFLAEALKKQMVEEVA